MREGAPTRDALLAAIAALILALPPDCVVRVGVDGVDGAGKSTFGDELAAPLVAAGRSVIRASVDGFHQPRALRYRRGRASPAGFFRDSYDYAAFRRELLDPLSPGGSGRYRTAAFDHRADAPVDAPALVAPPHAILVCDGIFLHRPELRPYWDFSVWLDVGVAVSVARCAGRDGSSPDPADAANQRYVAGQALYVRECAPARHATVVVDNNDLSAPRIVLRAG